MFCLILLFTGVERRMFYSLARKTMDDSGTSCLLFFLLFGFTVYQSGSVVGGVLFY